MPNDPQLQASLPVWLTRLVLSGLATLALYTTSSRDRPPSREEKAVIQSNMEAALAQVTRNGRTGVEIEGPGNNALHGLIGLLTPAAGQPALYRTDTRATITGVFYEPGGSQGQVREFELKPGMVMATSPIVNDPSGSVAIAIFREDDLFTPGADPIAVGIHNPNGSYAIESTNRGLALLPGVIDEGAKLV